MKRSLSAGILLILGVSLCQAQEDPLKITYVANEGFLVESGDTRVLIDALFTEGWGKYATPDPETLDAIRRGKKPFTEIDLLLVTHNHADHFHPAYVVEFMMNNSRATLLAPADAVEMLKKEPGYAAIGRRVTAISLPRGGDAALTVQGIDITVFRLDHYDDDSGAIQHLGFIWKAGGRTFFHAGDAALDDDSEYGPITDKAGIDIAFLPRWLLEDWTPGRALLERMRPKAAFFLHAPISDIGRFKSLSADRAAALTTAVVPEKRMETFRFRVTKKGWTAY